MNANHYTSSATMAIPPQLRPATVAPGLSSPPQAAVSRSFDGVICFGDSDWWYHNRGHYDLQMMRQLARHVPVLYINSIGVRMPKVSEGSMFVQRVRRKMQSLRRGLVTVQDNFSVFSPLVVPGRMGLLCSKQLLLLQVRWAARQLGIRQPLVWVACPSAATIAEQLQPTSLIYQRTDAYENFPGVDADLIRRLDQRMKNRADITLFCSSFLMDREALDCRNALFVDHGVDFDRFAAAGHTSGDSRPDGERGGNADTQASKNDGLRHVRQLPRPRVGFVGSIDNHTFDPTLFGEVVRRLPEVQFVLVGGCSLPEGWCRAPNVSLLGQQPYDLVADYMAACDVLIMPWNRSDWIRACNPVKLKEYLAVGRPVVSTPFEELRRYGGFVRVAATSEQFASHIREALADPPEADSLRQHVSDQTWTAKGRLVLRALAEASIVPWQQPPAVSGVTGVYGTDTAVVAEASGRRENRRI